MNQQSKRLQGLFEFDLEANGKPFRAIIEIKEPGIEISEVRNDVGAAWGHNFANSTSIPLETIKCVRWRQIDTKPADAVKSEGRPPILIWKSEPR
jgi:hypothetical protein